KKSTSPVAKAFINCVGVYGLAIPIDWRFWFFLLMIFMASYSSLFFYCFRFPITKTYDCRKTVDEQWEQRERSLERCSWPECRRGQPGLRQSWVRSCMPALAAA